MATAYRFFPSLGDLDLEDALYLHNILFDPREIRDLRVQRGWSATIAARPTHAYRALLRSWATAPQAAPGTVHGGVAHPQPERRWQISSS